MEQIDLSEEVYWNHNDNFFGFIDIFPHGLTFCHLNVKYAFDDFCQMQRSASSPLRGGWRLIEMSVIKRSSGS